MAYNELPVEVFQQMADRILSGAEDSETVIHTLTRNKHTPASIKKKIDDVWDKIVKRRIMRSVFREDNKEERNWD